MNQRGFAGADLLCFLAGFLFVTAVSAVYRAYDGPTGFMSDRSVEEHIREAGDDARRELAQRVRAHESASSARFLVATEHEQIEMEE